MRGLGMYSTRTRSMRNYSASTVKVWLWLSRLVCFLCLSFVSNQRHTMRLWTQNTRIKSIRVRWLKPIWQLYLYNFWFCVLIIYLYFIDEAAARQDTVIERLEGDGRRQALRAAQREHCPLWAVCHSLLVVREEYLWELPYYLFLICICLPQ